MAAIELYGYQKEVIQRALKGENIIVWLPTGGGKTRAAVYVARRHLETTPNAKVVVLANTVHLVNQHSSREFEPNLGDKYTVLAVSGDSEEKDYFGVVMQERDVIICTAQILYNSLMDAEEAKHIELSDITLMIIDECHHTKKDAVHNKIMSCYLEKKLNGEGPLPQILGLTASPGAGGARSMDKAVTHVLQICANLDSAIVSTKNYISELKEKVPRPKKEYDIVDKRPEDPFGDHLMGIMLQIQEFMDLPLDATLRELGTQEYEMDVVLLRQRGIKEKNRVMAQGATHLRQYNDALLINDTLRMIDAYESLEGFYNTKYDSAIDETDTFLVGLFVDNRAELRKLAMDPRFENPKMAKLESTLLKQFSSDKESQGILFSKTRISIHCLQKWVLENSALQRAGIKSAVLTGAGNGTTYMTQNEQTDTIRNFRRQKLNLLIATSIAEEGLDIPECNLVARYGLLTNEIAQLQASGRARAKNSVYSVVAQKGGREVRRERVNEYLEELTWKAVTWVQDLSPEDFRRKIAQIQRETLIAKKLEEELLARKKNCISASRVKLLCQNCFTPVATGSDIKIIENSLYVNTSNDFKKCYQIGPKVVMPKQFEDWEPGCKIRCNNGNCNQDFGFEIKYKKKVLLSNVAIKNFALETPKGRTTVKQWKDVPFIVEKFSFEEYCEENFPDLFD